MQHATFSTNFTIKFTLKTQFTASPLVRELPRSRRRQRSQVVWKQPEDNWNITTLPRSILPHLENKNYTHSLPAPGNVHYRMIDSDERMLEHFNVMKVSWFVIQSYNYAEIYQHNLAKQRNDFIINSLNFRTTRQRELCGANRTHPITIIHRSSIKR